MENASKALLMAGGVLLTMLVIALVLFAWSSLSDYYDEQDQLANIENVTEFNLQFTNYDRDDIHGYELISLVNKVADYNTRYSSADNNLSDAGYNPITVTIKLGEDENEVKASYSYDLNNIYLFLDEYKKVRTDITQNAVKSQITDIVKEAQITETALGGQDVASKVAKNITSLTVEGLRKNIKYQDEDKYSDAQLEKIIVANFNKTTGENYKKYTDVEAYIGGNGEKIKAYYEYYQFKKAIFECTSVTYDSETGRVSKMDFEFTGKIE